MTWTRYSARTATAGRPVGSRLGRSGGAVPRSRAGTPRVRRPWTPHAGPAPSRSRADSAQASRRSRRSLRDDPSPEDSSSQARSSNRAPQGPVAIRPRVLERDVAPEPRAGHAHLGMVEVVPTAVRGAFGEQLGVVWRRLHGIRGWRREASYRFFRRSVLRSARPGRAALATYTRGASGRVPRPPCRTTTRPGWAAPARPSCRCPSPAWSRPSPLPAHTDSNPHAGRPPSSNNVQ
jgi:hypothetical protein